MCMCKFPIMSLSSKLEKNRKNPFFSENKHQYQFWWDCLKNYNILFVFFKYWCSYIKDEHCGQIWKDSLHSEYLRDWHYTQRMCLLTSHNKVWYGLRGNAGLCCEVYVISPTLQHVREGKHMPNLMKHVNGLSPSPNPSGCITTL